MSTHRCKRLKSKITPKLVIFFLLILSRRTIELEEMAQVLVNWRGKGANGVHLYSQVVLPLERLAAHRAHVFPLIAVRQLVLRERRCVVEHLPADLQTETVLRVSASLCWCSIPDNRLNWLFTLSRLHDFSPLRTKYMLTKVFEHILSIYYEY